MTEALLEMARAERSSPEFLVGSLSRVAGDGRGLLYARRAIKVKPAKSRVRSAAVISGVVSLSEGGRSLAHWFSLYGDSCTNVLREGSVAAFE